MNTDSRVEAIRLLSNGRWHSGEALARRMGISRAAVWKRLRGLTDWGLDLQAVRGRGYRLAQPLELLDASVIRHGLALRTRERLAAIDVFPVLDSTSVWLMSHASDRGGHLCLAEYQTAGRGRRGRTWCSPFGANLYLSLSWSFAEMPPQLGALGLAMGVALADCLATLGLRTHGLKWPNDVLWQGRKLAGILIEHRGEGAGPARVVIGMGLNISMSRVQAETISQPWVTLAEAVQTEGLSMPGRNALCIAIVDALVHALEIFSIQGFSGFTQGWTPRDLARGRMVRLECDREVITGMACGIDGDGALLLEVNGQRRRFLSGDLSLRLMDTERG